MHRKLVLMAFEKAKSEEEKETGRIASNTKLSERISNDLWDKFKCTFGDKSLRLLYSDAIKENKKSVQIKQFKVVNALCKYLNYEDYKEFASKNPNKDKPLTFIDKIKLYFKQKKEIAVIVIISIGLLVIIQLNKQRWMVWENDHYVEVKFDTSEYDIGQLKLYNKERILNFKRVIPKCDSTVFFNEDKTVNLWYGKNSKGKIEFFTDYGLHPETEKTLKAISTHIIDKYICVEE